MMVVLVTRVGSNLYGTWLAFLASSPRADITLPSANSPQLMLNSVGYQSSRFSQSLSFQTAVTNLIPSFARSPVAPVRFSLSDPARSTK